MYRNDKCICGSGKKYKHCCIVHDSNVLYEIINTHNILINENIKETQIALCPNCNNKLSPLKEYYICTNCRTRFTNINMIRKNEIVPCKPFKVKCIDCKNHKNLILDKLYTVIATRKGIKEDSYILNEEFNIEVFQKRFEIID